MARDGYWDPETRLGRRRLDLGTPHGQRFFAGLAVEVDQLRRQRRAFARHYLDWTERSPHLPGALGAALRVTGR